MTAVLVAVVAFVSFVLGGGAMAILAVASGAESEDQSEG